MGYPVTKMNSCQFDWLGERCALGVIQDEGFGDWRIGIFRRTAAGDWNCVPPFIAMALTNEQIMAHGSIAQYLQSVFPIAERRLREMAENAKPDGADKPACVAYDLGLDVSFDASAGQFALNKAPPLSHAR